MLEFWGLAARSSQLDPSHPSANLELLRLTIKGYRQPAPSASASRIILGAGCRLLTVVHIESTWAT